MIYAAVRLKVVRTLTLTLTEKLFKSSYNHSMPIGYIISSVFEAIRDPVNLLQALKNFLFNEIVECYQDNLGIYCIPYKNVIGGKGKSISLKNTIRQTATKSRYLLYST